MSPYNPNDYQVLSTYTGGMFKEDILNGATISVKGAIFKIERVYTKNGPTRIFLFDSLNEFVGGDSSNELIEIGWNNAPAGLSKIGKELGLEYQMPSSIFSNGLREPCFIEEVCNDV